MKTFPGPQVKGHHTAEVIIKNLFDLVLHQYLISNVWGSYQQTGLFWWRGAHTTNPCPFACVPTRSGLRAAYAPSMRLHNAKVVKNLRNLSSEKQTWYDEKSKKIIF